jgi:hypothetical protein
VRGQAPCSDLPQDKCSCGGMCLLTDGRDEHSDGCVAEAGHNILRSVAAHKVDDVLEAWLRLSNVPHSLCLPRRSLAHGKGRCQYSAESTYKSASLSIASDTQDTSTKLTAAWNGGVSPPFHTRWFNTLPPPELSPCRKSDR